ncbi:hypothetical protein [Psychroserpens mesophilus]|nr:hypothetical protein [Psychroserpens mesophilus]
MERTSYVASVVLRNFRNSKKGISIKDIPKEIYKLLNPTAYIENS